MWALIPVKQFGFAKTRLSPVLSARQRSELFKAMVKDVLSVLSQHPLLEGVLMVSADPLARHLAEKYAVTWLDESRLEVRGLNGVVQASVSYLADQGIDDVLVIHGDLPLIDQEEITGLIGEHQKLGPRALTLASDRAGDGSNCLLCRPAGLFRFRYGAGSFQRHLVQARSMRMRTHVAQLAGASLDIDTPDDLRELLKSINPVKAPCTWRYLRQIDLAEKLGNWRQQSRISQRQHERTIEQVS